MNTTDENLPLAARLSIFYSAIFGFVTTAYLIKLTGAMWGHSTLLNRTCMILGLAYAIMVPTSAFIYAAKESRLPGIIHAVLMLGAGGSLFLCAAHIFCDPSTFQAADNPVGGIMLLTAAGIALAGAIGVGLAIAVLHHLFSTKQEDPPTQDSL